MNLLSFLFPKPKSVTVNTFKVKKTDAEKLRDAKTEQLRRELGLLPPDHEWESAIAEAMAIAAIKPRHRVKAGRS